MVPQAASPAALCPLPLHPLFPLLITPPPFPPSPLHPSFHPLTTPHPLPPLLQATQDLPTCCSAGRNQKSSLAYSSSELLQHVVSTATVHHTCCSPHHMILTTGFASHRQVLVGVTQYVVLYTLSLQNCSCSQLAVQVPCVTMAIGEEEPSIAGQAPAQLGSLSFFFIKACDGQLESCKGTRTEAETDGRP